ncbi:MAG: FAD-dependent oxidoreductase, partial [Anaerolineae bacterium]|nr:FAD-dependent oxidoreductase [Anaerolineae bacterium]
MTTKNDNIVIVGAGMAGLTAAAYLTREGYNVLLLDKNDRTGGLVNTMNYDGFYFDTGPRAFVNSGIVKPILKDLDITWPFLENKIAIGIEDQMFRVDSMDAINEYQRILEKLYPQNMGEIQKIMTSIKQLSAYTAILYEFDNPNFVDFKSDAQFIFKKLIPWTIKFLFALRKMNQFKMPMEDFLNRLTANQSLIDILIQFFFRKTPTYFALGYFYVYLDYFYPKGGTAVLANLLEDKVLAGGGEVKCNTEIVEVIPSASLVKDADGMTYAYDHLIWAA